MFFDVYFYIAVIAIVSQLLFLFQAHRNYRYVLVKYKKERSWHKLRTVLIVPCKGIDVGFEQDIASFFNQDYENYLLWFVVADKADPAYAQLCRFRDQLSKTSQAQDVRILVAGPSQSCSQKIHNLLYCYERIPDETDVLAFADSDICVRPDWLSHLVWPLRQFRYGAAAGYRWFIPNKNNLASLALSALNAKVALLLGNTPFNQAWGGSMAIRVDVFRQVGLDKIWPKALSDDLSLTCAVKKAGMKVAFVPACLVASYESTTWAELLEFGRRQLLITRVYAPGTWLFGLFSSLYSVSGLWGGVVVALCAALTRQKHLALFAAVPAVFFVRQIGQAALREKMIARLLRTEMAQMKAAMAADIFGSWIWSVLLLLLIISSAFGRTICWRGIRYKLLGPTRIVVENPERKYP